MSKHGPPTIPLPPERGVITSIRGLKHMDHPISFYTGLGLWRAEIFPGVYLVTKRPCLWKRIVLYLCFGIRFKQEHHGCRT